MVFPSISRIKELGIRPRKKHGQNFLVDSNLAAKTVQSASISPEDTVIEIGAGPGSLTFFLAETRAHTTCFEIDTWLFEILSSSFQDNPLIIPVNRDILEVDFKKYVTGTTGKIILIGSIPYSITSPILLNVFRNCNIISHAVFIVQKEVAQRLCAPVSTKQYGIFSIYCNAYMKTRSLFTIPAGSFYPKPKVDSEVILMQATGNKDWNNRTEVFFRQVVRSAFSSRRKMLSNALKNLILKNKIDCDILKRKSLANGIDLNRRAETLSTEEFYALAKIISSYNAD